MYNGGIVVRLESEEGFNDCEGYVKRIKELMWGVFIGLWWEELSIKKNNYYSGLKYMKIFYIMEL